MAKHEKRVSTISLGYTKETAQEDIQLPPLEATALCTILEDTIDQIIILGSIDNNPTTTEVQLKIDDLKIRAEKYAKNDPIYNILNGELFSHTVNKMKYLKLQLDRKFLQEILVQIKEELYREHTFNSLLEFLNEYRTAEYEEMKLVTDESNNKIRASVLRNAVRKKVDESHTELHRVHEMIAKCKDDIETMLFDNAVKLRYVENWENARIEQGFMICDQNENEFAEIINEYKNEIEKEIRINSEIELFITENQKDIEQGIESWTQRYSNELEERQTEIQMLKEKKEEQQKRFESMSVIYEEHGLAIQDFLDYKERKRVKEELDALQEAACTKIQAWWRGLMVRLQLGPFNPNPKKAKKGKKLKQNKPKKKK